MFVALAILAQNGQERKDAHAAADERDALLLFRDAKPVAEGQHARQHIALLRTRKQLRPLALDLVTHAYDARCAVV